MLLRVWSISHRVTAHGKSQLLLSEIGTDDIERRQSPLCLRNGSWWGEYG